MKTLLAAIEKGGAGKSAFLTQFSYYLAIEDLRKTLVVEFDHQKNTSKAIIASSMAFVSTVTASEIFTLPDSADRFIKEYLEAGSPSFAMVSGDSMLINLEREASNHNAFATNVINFLEKVSPYFDNCLIDTNPNPDIRVKAALVATNFLISPVELKQESLDGIAALLGLVRQIKKINPELSFIGFLPNKVESTPFQKNNFKILVENYSHLMIRLANSKDIAAIANRTAITEAQAVGKPFWLLGKTSSRTAWTEIKPVFETIAEIIK